jgi:phage terminase large subunit-like protein
MQMNLQRQANVSLAAWIASHPESERERLLREIAPTATERVALEYEWRFWARPNQIAPEGAWHVWLVSAGRGYGKTRTGAEWVNDRAKRNPHERIALIGATAADTRDVMVEGESGILAVSPPWNRPHYEPSKRRLTWPNGAMATTYSAEEPDRLRGPQHGAAWADEVAAWAYPETWDQLMFGLRLGTDPRVIATTTPRPTALIRRLMKDPHTVVTRGSTFENAANLAPSFLADVRRKYEGTRLGRQELFAELLDDTPGALWNYAQIDALRVPRAPALRRIVVAIDPAVTANEESDETGIVVAGLGEDGHGYVLQDLSGKFSPDGWARLAVQAYRTYEADRIIAEVNNGGDLVERVIRTVDPHVPYTAVHASRGKRVRAEPVAALDEQGRVHHVGSFAALEDQMCTWDSTTGERSPDRMDARVWAITELMLNPGAAEYRGLLEGVAPKRRI